MIKLVKMIGGHYLIGFALLLVCGALAAPRLPMEYEAPLSFQTLNAPLSDPDSYGVLLPRLAPKYHRSLNWDMIEEPRPYLISELEGALYLDDPMRSKRRQPSLSIGTSYDVLRGKLALDLARKQAKETKIQAERNRAFLKNIGKRDTAPRDGQHVYYADPKLEDKMAASQEYNQANVL